MVATPAKTPKPAKPAGQGTGDKHWAVLVLARVRSDQVGAFVPNPGGQVQKPCHFTVVSALQALNAASMEEAMGRPALAQQINTIVQRHA